MTRKKQMFQWTKEQALMTRESSKQGQDDYSKSLTDWDIYRTMTSPANMSAAHSNVIWQLVLHCNSKHLFV